MCKFRVTYLVINLFQSAHPSWGKTCTLVPLWSNLCFMRTVQIPLLQRGSAEDNHILIFVPMFILLVPFLWVWFIPSSSQSAFWLSLWIFWVEAMKLICSVTFSCCSWKLWCGAGILDDTCSNLVAQWFCSWWYFGYQCLLQYRLSKESSPFPPSTSALTENWLEMFKNPGFLSISPARGVTSTLFKITRFILGRYCNLGSLLFFPFFFPYPDEKIESWIVCTDPFVDR